MFSVYFACIIGIADTTQARANTQNPCKKEDVKLASDYVQSTIRNFEDGVVSKVDVLLAKNALADVRLCAGALQMDEYCETKSLVLADLLRMIQSRTKDGYGSSFSLADYFTKYVEYRKVCADFAL